MALTLPIHGAIYLQDTARTGVTTSLVAVSGTPSTATDGFLTEHNRGPVAVDNDLIQNAKRSVNGTMRTYTIATKKKFSTSWSSVPADYAHTVDGKTVATSGAIVGMGGNDMLIHYLAYYNRLPFYLYVLNRTTTKTGTGTQANINTDLATAASAGERYLVQYESFNYDIVKRATKASAALGNTDYWDVDVSFVEV